MRWFKPFGVLFLPVSVAGSALTLAAAAWCVWIFLKVDSRSHSVSDTLYGVVLAWAAAGVLWWLVAMATSRSPAHEP